MSPKEAIKHIRSDMSGFATEDYFRAHYMAIEALEKQIPKRLGEHFACPNCGEIVGDGFYCEWCGQALDFNGEDNE